MAELAQVLRPLLPVDDPNALVDASTGDDAAVYRLGGGRALVVTLDFFTPVVDDPYDFGRIAAANALSDVYAMGARPLFVLNLLGFPRSLLNEGLAERIIEGGMAVAREAGVAVLGGHSVDDPEPKYGMVAVGEVAEARLLTNAGARPGDVLVLTKALGTGVITTALKAGTAPAEAIEAAVASMTTLNAGAAEAVTMVRGPDDSAGGRGDARDIGPMGATGSPEAAPARAGASAESRAARAWGTAPAGVHAGTDVTGYGLLGHLRAMLRASVVAAEIEADAVPFLPGAVDLVRAGHVPGGTKRNLADLATDVAFAEGVPDEVRTLLADAQTSGGLLIAVAPDRADDLVAALAGRAPHAAVVGRVVEGRAGSIRVV